MVNSKLHVLLVEDVKLAQKCATLVLHELGCTVDIAATGVSALEMIKEKSFNLIFMDLGLPDISGISVTKKIRGSNNLNKDTLIIALTANDDSGSQKSALDAGMDGFLLKPLTIESMNSLLSQYKNRFARF